MTKITKLLLFLLIAIGIGMMSLGCTSEPEVVIETVEVEVIVTEVVTEIVTQEVETIIEITPEPAPNTPFIEAWMTSAHAAADTEPFRHWDEDDPPEVSERCARCHTSSGYADYLGADGSEFGVVDTAHNPEQFGIVCEACHNDVTLSLTAVTMPSGIELTGLGDESRCMVCHQGRASKFTVDTSIEEAGVGDDEFSEDLGFINIHYYAAAATKYGTAAKGGYEYEGKTYDSFFTHVEDYAACIDCHDPHTLELKVDECQACHLDVESAEDFLDVRMPGSLVDYDGDGDVREGVHYELETLKEILYVAMQDYAVSVGTSLVYDSSSYPYFFDDAGERFAGWTPRLLKAAYNFQVASKDPGAHAHGGKYIIQLLYDSIEDLNPEMVVGLRRIDHGHFAGSEEAFRHWDEDGEVPGRCSRCHSAEGLPLYLTQGVTINQPLSNGLLCSTCHEEVGGEWTRYAVESVEFPSGATVAIEEGAAAGLCMSCHQGRSSGATVDAAVGDLDNDTVGESLRFINIHYFAAGATRYGSEVNGAYEYANKEYVGYFEHVPAADDCAECHNAHQLEVQLDTCANCHEGVDTTEALYDIRVSEADYDGDGDVTEGLAGEISTMVEVLYEAMQAYSLATDGVDPIEYNSHRYPYFFNDAGDRYATFTPALVKAAYNYQYAQKDPGGFAHNGMYVIQVLYDGIEDLGGDVSAMTRP